jgi:hypothetical protein
MLMSRNTDDRIPNVGIGAPFHYGPHSLGDAICHRSWMTHWLVQPGQKMPPKLNAGEKRQWGRLEIVVWLTGEDFIVRNFNMHEGIPLTMSLRHPHGSLPNLSAAWNWAVKPTRDYLNALVEERFLTPELGTALIGRLPRDRRSKREQLPKRSREAVWTKTSGLCVYCGQTLTMKAGQPNTFHADHVLSVKKGGSDDIANLIPSCATCNSKKGAKTVIEHLLGKAAE